MRKTRGIALFIASALMLSAFSCNSSQIHKASDAAAKISIGLQAIEKVNESLYPSELSADETIAISHGVSAATRANDAFVVCVQGLKSNANAGAISCLQGLVQQLESLNNQALLGVKNPDARARLALEFQAVETAANFIAGYFGAPPLQTQKAINATPLQSPSGSDYTLQQAWRDPRAITLI